MSLIKFLNSIHAPKDIIDKVENDIDIEGDIDKISKDYLESRESFYEATKLKSKLEPEIEKTVKGMALKSIKKINELTGMGLTNSQMEELVKKDDPISAFVTDAKKHLDSEMAKLKTGTVEDISKETEKFKDLHTKSQKQLEELQEKWKAFEAQKDAEVAEKIATFEAKQYWNKIVQNDKEIADVPGKGFALTAIEKEIFGKYKVDANGNITNLDGSTATHPEKQINVTKLDEIYPYFKAIAGLEIKSNAGVGADGKPIKVVTEMGPNERNMIEQLEAASKIGK